MGFRLELDEVLLLFHVLCVQLAGRAGVTAETFVHVLTAYFKGEEQVFVGGVRVNAELGEIAEETLASGTGSMRERVFRLGKECVEFITSQFWHGLIVRPIARWLILQMSWKSCCLLMGP